MDLNKSLEFFDPANVKARCHIIGCGSIGGNVAELLARYGVSELVLWDFDDVEPHNIANQIYTTSDIEIPKTIALSAILEDINPDIKLKLKQKYEGQPLEGFVFMCVDSVEVRRNIVEANWYNPEIIAVFDFRTTLLEGQCYFADWKNQKQKDSLKESLNFTHEEAKANTPVSACGFELSVSPVVKICSIMGIVNFTNFINNKPTKHVIICDPYSYDFMAM
jgi:molybdopterin/thiamine biosynthesis adenylyltransferase